MTYLIRYEAWEVEVGVISGSQGYPYLVTIHPIRKMANLSEDLSFISLLIFTFSQIILTILFFLKENDWSKE